MYTYTRGIGWVYRTHESKMITVGEYSILMEFRRPEIGELFYYYPKRSFGKNFESLAKHVSKMRADTFGAAMYENSDRCRYMYSMNDPETEYVTLTVSRTSATSEQPV